MEEVRAGAIRLRNEEEQDQFDLEKIEFQQKVREGFLYAAEHNKSHKVFILNGEQPKDEIHKQIVNLFEKYII